LLVDSTLVKKIKYLLFFIQNHNAVKLIYLKMVLLN
jgi:hypothetical protein